LGAGYRTAYYDNFKRPEDMKKCHDLMHDLKTQTRARIAFGIWDKAIPAQIELIASNWL